jgi:hypothetical protein
MTKIAYTLALLSAMLVSSYSAPAQARARVFVASYGNDANPCTFGSPCKTFQQAVNVVDAGGEVTAIDSAGFGPIFISKAVTITSPDGVEAGMVPAAAGADAMTIDAGPTDAIGLRGLTIAGPGLNGITFFQGGSLTVQNCVFRNFTGQGINFVLEIDSSLSVSHSYVGNNGGHGILVQPSFSASATATFNYVETQYNGPSSYGIMLDATLTPGTVYGSVKDSVSSNNGGGYIMHSSSSVGSKLTVVRSVAANNHTGVQGTGNLWISETTITNNVLNCGGVVGSFHDNIVSGDCDAALAATKQ